MGKIIYTILLIFMASILTISLLVEWSDQDLKTEATSERERPETVPQNAVWRGGIDGGNFFQCEENSDKRTVSCRVFNDFTGQVDLLVTYDISTLKYEVNPWSIEAFYEKIDGFDGTYIYLLGSHRLTPLP